MQTFAASPAISAPAFAPSRCVAVWTDDAEAAAPWHAALAAEGLVVATGVPGQAPADAGVLHVSRGLAPQLGRLRELRQHAPALPLVVACRGLRELDQVLALEMGADDVFDAALGAPVVAARLRALWRRHGGAAEPNELVFGPLRLLLRDRHVWLGARRVPLSEGEFEVVWLLACHAGQVVPRREILRRVRGLDDHPLDRSIDSRVYRLRAKLGDSDRAARRIRTVRNLGYAFSPVGW
jgi:DNA-binding response OmpR family regulator